MTKKEVLIKLFKEKVSILACSVFSKNTETATLRDGSSFRVGFKTFVIAIATFHIEFEGVMEDITAQEYIELKHFWDEAKLRQAQEKIEEVKLQEQISLDVLSELASLGNYNIDRRVLTEKKTKNNYFKF